MSVILNIPHGTKPQFYIRRPSFNGRLYPWRRVHFEFHPNIGANAITKNNAEKVGIEAFRMCSEPLDEDTTVYFLRGNIDILIRIKKFKLVIKDVDVIVAENNVFSKIVA